MTDSGATRFGRFGWALAVAGLLLGNSGAALAVNLPDLGVTALTNPPETALPGESFAVTATIKNQGAAVAPASTTKFSLSSDGKTPVKDLQGVQSVPALQATEVSAPVATVAVGPGTPSGAYYLLACADGLAQILEAKENNNCRKSAEKITVLALPDLEVTAITDPPAAAPPGQSFKVTNTVKNAGMVPSPTATTKYSLVSTSSVTQVDLDGAQSVPGLTPGQTFTDEETVTIRGNTPSGEYRVLACADAGKAVSEDDEADNCLLSTGTILVTTLPDLRLSTVTLANAPVTVTPGGTIEVGAVVLNAGVAPAGASTITFALVNGAGTARSLTGTQEVPVLAGGSSTTTQTTVTVPSDTPFATYTARACIDAAGNVPEASDANNCTSAAGTVKVGAVVLPKPDLIVAALTDAPVSVLPSETFIATATIKNQGAAASVASTTKFNLVSADGLTRKNLKGVQSVAALAAGASDGPAVTLKVYGDTVPGAYFFQACADGAGDVPETVESNNCVTMPRGIRVREAPDLLAIAVSDPPATATQGQSIQVTSTIKNVGTVTATESITRYYLVATDGSGKLDLKGKPILPAINPGNSFTEKDTVTVRPATVPGSYYLQVCADSGKVLAEKNENNNCITSLKAIRVTERPDLVVTSVVLQALQPTKVPLGGAISVEITVENQGPGPAGESAFRLFLIDTVTGVSKDLKGHPSVSGLDPTKSKVVKGTVTVFADTRLGFYTLRACADYKEIVAEIDEDNNCATGTETIKVKAAPPVPAS
jgi:subtilase family serine protease